MLLVLSFLFSLLFGLTEFIRGNILTGFPWNLIVYSFSENLTFMSPLSIVGTYSFNLLMISFFCYTSSFFLKKIKKRNFYLHFYRIFTNFIYFLWFIIQRKFFK